MARTRSHPAPSSGSAEPKAQAVTTLVTTEIGEQTATYYANHAEIAALPHDFAMLFARIPAKLSPEKLEQAKAGMVILPADVQIVIPATLIDGLIRALNVAKTIYEERYGAIHDKGGPDAGPRS